MDSKARILLACFLTVSYQIKATLAFSPGLGKMFTPIGKKFKVACLVEHMKVLNKDLCEKNERKTRHHFRSLFITTEFT